MRRPPALVSVGLTALSVLALPAHAGSVSGSGSYDVHVLPDPSHDVSPYGRCGIANGAVLGNGIGEDARRYRVPARGTLRVGVVPQLNVFAGDIGLNWSVRLYDTQFRELARSSGPAWRSEVSRSFAGPRDIVIAVCNRRGHPDATVSYSFNPS
jgi:hypothetical protein